MMFRRVPFILLFLLLAYGGRSTAQMRYSADDTLLFHFDQPVLLTAGRVPAELLHAPAPTQVLRKEELAPLPAITVGDALRYAPGTVVREYGAQGLQLAGMRGLGAEYTLVYLNGVRLNDAQNSVVDLGLLSLAGMEQIDIVRGGHAALYGSNALGGVVNIHAGSGSTLPSFTVGAGSFGWRTIRAAGGIRSGAVRVSVTGGYEDAENGYPFVSAQRPGEELSRRNADMIKRFAGLAAVSAFSASAVTLYADWVHADVGAPGAYTGGRQGRARQSDERLLAVLGYRVNTAAAGTFSLGADVRFSTQEYADPEYVIAGTPLRSTYDNSHAALTLAWDAAILPGIRLSTGAEFAADRLESAEVSGSPQRISSAGYAAVDWRAGPLHLFPALRFDTHDDVDPARSVSFWSPSFGIRWNAMETLLALRVRGSRNYSNPTFNQLYWKQGGNPDLRAEHSTAYDAGVELRPFSWLPQVEATYFHHDIADKIIWLPGEGSFWTPENIQHVVSNGLELAVSATAGNLLRLRLHGQWISARKVNASFPGDATEGKQLIYVPVFSGGGVLTADVTSWLQLTVTEQIAGERFTTESNDRSLPPYALTDVTAVFRGEVGAAVLQLKAEVLNLFDTSYEIAALYPMPGRQVRLSLTTEF